MSNSCKLCFKLVTAPVTCIKCNALYHFRCVPTSLNVFIHPEGKLNVFCCRDVFTNLDIKVENSVVSVDGVAIKQEVFDETDDYTPTNFNTEPDFSKFLLELRQNPINNTKGVYTLKPLHNGRVFGPYEGIKLIEADHSYASGTNKGKLIDVECEQECCWMRYVTCTDKSDDANLQTVQYGDTICYKSSRDIMMGEELLIYCADRKNQFDDKCICCLVNYSLINQSQVHLPQKILIQCPFCNINFMGERNYNFHVSRCEKSDTYWKNQTRKTWKCHLCNFTASFRYLLQKHISRHTKNKGDYECKLCKLHFLNFEYYKRHLQTFMDDNKSCVTVYGSRRHRGNLYGCHLCGYTTVAVSALRKHVINHENESEGQMKCQFCKLHFIDESYFKEHINKCKGRVRIKPLGSDAKTYGCHKCAFRTQRKSSILQHCRKHKNGAFQCTICKIKFLNHEFGVMHLDKCKNKEISRRKQSLLSVEKHKLKWGCHICEFRASFKYLLVKHISMHTANVDDYEKSEI